MVQQVGPAYRSYFDDEMKSSSNWIVVVVLLLLLGDLALPSLLSVVVVVGYQELLN